MNADRQCFVYKEQHGPYHKALGTPLRTGISDDKTSSIQNLTECSPKKNATHRRIAGDMVNFRASQKFIRDSPYRRLLIDPRGPY